MRKLALTARSPLEYVVLLSHLEGCTWFSYSQFIAERNNASEEAPTIVSITVRNPGRPQLDETVYVAESTWVAVAERFRYKVGSSVPTTTDAKPKIRG